MPDTRPRAALAKGSRYSEHEINAGLTALALCSGNTRRASKLLAQSGERKVPPKTLYDWSTKHHVQRYRDVQEASLPELNRRLAEAHDELVAAYTELQTEAIAKAREGIPDLKATEAGRLAKDAAIGAGINTEKALLRRGQPTSISEHRSTAEILKTLAEKYPGVVKVDPALLEVKVIEEGVEDPPPSKHEAE